MNHKKALARFVSGDAVPTCMKVIAIYKAFYGTPWTFSVEELEEDCPCRPAVELQERTRVEEMVYEKTKDAWQVFRHTRTALKLKVEKDEDTPGWLVIGVDESGKQYGLGLLYLESQAQRYAEWLAETVDHFSFNKE